MAQFLDDGTVIPSFLSTTSFGGSEGTDNYSTIQLLYGEVKDIIYPSDKNSRSQALIEYSVDVQKREDGNARTTNYPHCYLANLFGGTADFFKYTLRADKKEQTASAVFTTGSKVLMMCINGETTQAYIVGGIRDDKVKDSKEDGHNLKFEFNGINVSINKDGELQVKYRGATKVDGTLDDNADSEAEGTTITMSKDGSVSISTKDNAQYIKLNKPDKKVEIQVDEGVKVNKADEAWMLGTTFRKEQKQMHQQLQSQIQQLQGNIRSLAMALNTIGGKVAIPVSGAVASAADFTSAGIAMQSAAGALGSMSQTISSFEAKSDDYISKKNFGSK